MPESDSEQLMDGAGDPSSRGFKLGKRRQARLALEVVAGPHAGLQVQPRTQSTLCVGRSTSADLELKHPAVSPYHVELSSMGTSVRILDLGSASGTFVGAIQLRDAMVPYGTEFRVGEDTIRVEPLPDVELPAEQLPPLPPGAGEFVACSQLARGALVSLYRVAQARVPLLLVGEAGTGKRSFARLAYELSGLADVAAPTELPAPTRAFVEVAAHGAAREVSARLFGHAPGAFRGASAGSASAIERAGSGVIYLRHVSELPVETQITLARALEQLQFSPLGSAARQPLCARVVASSRFDLRPLVNAGYFREDLYFRLASTPVWLPPLYQRPEDIEPLVREFERRLGLSEAQLGPGWLTRIRGQRFERNLHDLWDIVRDAALHAATGTPKPP